MSQSSDGARSQRDGRKEEHRDSCQRQQESAVSREPDDGSARDRREHEARDPRRRRNKLAIEAHDGDEQPGRQDAFRYQRCNGAPDRAEVGHERERERQRARSSERAADRKRADLLDGEQQIAPEDEGKRERQRHSEHLQNGHRGRVRAAADQTDRYRRSCCSRGRECHARDQRRLRQGQPAQVGGTARVPEFRGLAQ